MKELGLSNELTAEIFKFAKTTKWKDDTAAGVILLAAKKALHNILEKYPAAENNKPSFIRLCGQSGSGKTTQLLPAVKAVAKEQNYIFLAVRDFVPYHPLYSELKNQKEALREVTNGFALKVLTVVLFELLSLKINVVLEMTLLSPRFEKLVAKELTGHNYTSVFLILGISKQLSDSFILKRQTLSKTESGRVVNSYSKAYFYKNLNRSLSMLSHRLKHTRAIVWSAGNLEPIFDGFLQYAPKYVKLSRKMTTLTCSEPQLLKAKIQYLNCNFPKLPLN